MMGAFVFGFILGCVCLMGAIKFIEYLQLRKLKDEQNSVYNEIIGLVGTSSVKFSSRYNNTVTFLVSTTFKGKVDLVFFLDKLDFRILSKGEFILGTEHTDKKIIEDLCLKLEESYDKDLKDCVKVMGHIVDRKTVKLVNPDVTFPPAFPEEEVEESNFTIDGVLDRITQVGMENLTDDEKRFLEQYQKTL